jgi:hypothetical protein
MEFIERIRKETIESNAKIKILDQYLLVSPTRYETLGVFKYAFIEQLAQLLFLMLKLDTKFIYDFCYVKLPEILKIFRA